MDQVLDKAAEEPIWKLAFWQPELASTITAKKHDDSNFILYINVTGELGLNGTVR